MDNTIDEIRQSYQHSEDVGELRNQITYLLKTVDELDAELDAADAFAREVIENL